MRTPAVVSVWIACVMTLRLTAPGYGAELLLITDPASLGNPADPLAFDQELVEMLEDFGHTVVNADDREDVGTFASAFRNGPPTEDELEGIDIVVVSRGANSGEYDDGTEPDDWNSLEIPLILLSPYHTRTSRWGWINSTAVVNAGPAPEDFDPFPDPDHPFVAGRTTSVFPPNDVIDYINSLDVPVDSTIVATLTIDGNVTPAILDIPADAELFSNAQGVVSITGERRVLYQMLDYVDNDDIFRISENGFEILHQIIETLAPSIEPEPEGPRFIRGNCNGDENLNIADAVCALGWMFGGNRDAVSCAAALNANGDGSVNIADAVYLLTFLFGAGPDPVAPHPGCGLGTLALDEQLGCETQAACE